MPAAAPPPGLTGPATSTRASRSACSSATLLPASASWLLSIESVLADTVAGAYGFASSNRIAQCPGRPKSGGAAVIANAR